MEVCWMGHYPHWPLFLFHSRGRGSQRRVLFPGYQGYSQTWTQQSWESASLLRTSELLRKLSSVRRLWAWRSTAESRSCPPVCAWLFPVPPQSPALLWCLKHFCLWADCPQNYGHRGSPVVSVTHLQGLHQIAFENLVQRHVFYQNRLTLCFVVNCSGVTLTTSCVPCVWLSSTSFVHHIVCASPRVQSPFTTVCLPPYLLHPPPPTPQANKQNEWHFKDSISCYLIICYTYINTFNTPSYILGFYVL